MEHQMPVLEQVNIVTGNFARSLDFYSRLGVKFPSLGDDPTGDHFHANGRPRTSSGWSWIVPRSHGYGTRPGAPAPTSRVVSCSGSVSLRGTR